MTLKLLLGFVLVLMVGYLGSLGAALICTTESLAEITTTQRSNGTTALDRQLKQVAKEAVLSHLKEGASFSQDNPLDAETIVVRYPGTETYLVQGTVRQKGCPMGYAVVISRAGATNEAYYLMLNGTSFGDHFRLRHDVDVERKAWQQAANERKGKI
jgi:hypothetical protein